MKFPLIEAYMFGKTHGLEPQVTEIKGMEVEWHRKIKSSVRRGFMIDLFQKHSLLTRFQQEHWPAGGSPEGQAEVRRCLRLKDDYEAFLNGSTPISDSPEEENRDLEDEESLEFAIEAHLRDFLARNLHTIEVGLHLYEADGRSGIEFSVDGGRIDLLAVDANGKFVVIELKLSKGRTKALGQLLYYMGWVDEHLGNSPSRGIIVASEIGDELSTAVGRVPGVKLAKYRMNFAIDWVGSPQG
jgi:hypothetical protein